MIAGPSLPSERHFLCSICLDVFTDPVSTSCGHNFCSSCISRHWDVNVPHNCPVCKEMFAVRPQLRVNTFIRELVDEFRREVQIKSCSGGGSEEAAAKPGEVPCDVCTGTRLKAFKSCLVCLLSYCETHLEPHLTRSGLKRHQLMEPVENLEDRMCQEHGRPLELFCKTDQMCVCLLCSIFDHKTHDFVPLREECEGKKAELKKMEVELQLQIHKKQLKIQEIRESLKVSKDAAGVQVFAALKDSIERDLNEFRVTRRAEDFIEDLEQEISKLKKRSSELERLLRSEDHLHLLQSFSFLKDRMETSIHPPSYKGAECRVVDQLEKTLRMQTRQVVEAELRRVRQYAVDVTLDPQTANPWLLLSEDGRQVHCGDMGQDLPENPARFSECVNVLGKQSFSSGRFYLEVQVRGKTDWDLGVARESISRKEVVSLRPEHGYWTIWMRNRKHYEALDAPSVHLSLQHAPEKVGVFVDYEGGLVSFYDVNAAVLIYSFTGCSFADKLHLFLSPGLREGGENSAPLIICPVAPQTHLGPVEMKMKSSCCVF